MAIETSRDLRAQKEETWSLVTEGFDPLNERGAEAVFTLANGHFGVRASLEEGNPASNPMIIVAGIYLPTDSPVEQTLLTLGDPTMLFVTSEGLHFSMSSVRTNEHIRELDLHKAVLNRSWSFTDRHGRSWRWRSLRAASAVRPTIYLYQLELTLEQGETPARVLFALPNAAILSKDGYVAESTLEITAEESADLVTSRLLVYGEQADMAESTISAVVRPNESLVLKMVNQIVPKGQPSPSVPFEDLLNEHEKEWEKRWQIADIKVHGYERLERSLRFASYHMLSATTVNEGRTSIGPRGLSGVAYHGHVFWDTEVFLLPFLTWIWPEAARSCLLYRHRTLPAARQRAVSFGYEGAMYAWESTDTGEDKTPDFGVMPDGSSIRILNGEQENHITADVAYAVIHYWRGSGDDDFMLRYGAEILIECARFWRSRVSLANDAYVIRSVIGPDEYHEGVDNNAFTNAMARWTILQAESYLRELSELDRKAAQALMSRLNVSEREMADWRHAGDLIVRSSFLQDDLVEQFDGFFGLDSVDVASYLRAGVPLDIAIGHEAMQKIRAVKQADVVMAICLMPWLWTEASARRNFEYYEPITCHTSSLSPPVHALVAASLREGELCRKYLEWAMDIDLTESFRGAAGGVRIASLGALRQTALFGLAGFKFNSEEIGFDPFLPDPISGLECSLHWRKRRVDVQIDSTKVQVKITGAPCHVRVNMEERLIRPGEWESFSYDPSVTFWAAIGRKGYSDGI